MTIHPALTKEHEKLRKEVRDFAEKEIKPLAADLDERGEFSSGLTLKLGKLGLFGITLPKKYGGREMDMLSYIIAVEELARVDGSQAATVASHNSLGLAPIFNFGTEQQKDELLPKLTSGERLWAFGLTEPNAGSDARATETTAELENKEWIINGKKIFITNAASDLSAGVTIELSVILVPRESEGYKSERITNKMMWRAADTGILVFNNCRVSERNLLGKRGQGAKIMFNTLDSGRLSIAAMGLGLAQGAFELAMDYARKRQQFGKPVYKFQAISFKLADMATKLELARNQLYTTCWIKDNGMPFGKEAAIAKLRNRR